MFEAWKDNFVKLLSSPIKKIEHGVSLKRQGLGWVVDSDYPTTKLILDSEKFEKSKVAQIGETREWKGQNYKKDASGKWILVTEKKTNSKSDSTEKDFSKLSEEEVSQYARSAKTESLKRHSEGGDEKMRLAAKAELSRREKEETPEGESVGKDGQESKLDIKENKEKDSVLTVDQKSEAISLKYKEVVGELMNPEIFSRPEELTKLSNQQKELARYLKRTTEFEGVDQEQAKTEILKKLDLTTDNELQDFVGDGKILAMKKSFGELSFLTEDCYCQLNVGGGDICRLSEIILDVELEKGKGKGTEIFSNQLEQLKAKGYKSIELTAAKSETYNGYYTWGILGFEIDKNSGKSSKGLKDFQNLVKTSEDSRIKKCKKLSELMSFKQGAEFWKENGFQFEGKFDISEKSNSMKLLNNYLEKRKIKN